MMTSNTFLQKQNDRTNNYLEDLLSEIVVTFILRKQQTIEYKTHLTTKASIPEYILYIDIRALASARSPYFIECPLYVFMLALDLI